MSQTTKCKNNYFDSANIGKKIHKNARFAKKYLTKSSFFKIIFVTLHSNIILT